MRTYTTNNQQTPISELSEKEVRFQKGINEFCKEHLESIVMKMDDEAKLDDRLIKGLFAQQYMNIEIPIEYGGAGNSFMETILAIEEFTKIDPSVAVFIDVQNTLVNNAILTYGNEVQKASFLPRLAKNAVGAFSITEEHAGSDAYALSSTAVKKDGGYVLNGKKHLATNAAEAEIFLVFAKTMDNNNNDSITAFIVDKKETEGFRILKREEKLGIRASSTCGIQMDEVFVPSENILGSIGRGKRIALEILTDGRVGIGAQMLGLAQGAFNLAVSYAKKREQFGKSIGSYQGVHFKLADIAAQIEATRLLVYNAARMKMNNLNFSEYFRSASITKYFASKVAEEAASITMDVMGGFGYLKNNMAEKFYRDAKIGKIYEGTSNMQLRIIAKSFIRFND